MEKKAKTFNISKIQKKIKLARQLSKNLNLKEAKAGNTEIYIKLKELSDKTELTYNDLVVKQSKSVSAFQALLKLEAQLDELFKQSNNLIKN